jgi:hypothetical protein
MKSSIKKLKIAIIILSITNIIAIVAVVGVYRVQDANTENLYGSGLLFEARNLRYELSRIGVLPDGSNDPCRDIPEEDCPAIDEESEYFVPYVLDVADINRRLQALEASSRK